MNCCHPLITRKYTRICASQKIHSKKAVPVITILCHNPSCQKSAWPVWGKLQWLPRQRSFPKGNRYTNCGRWRIKQSALKGLPVEITIHITRDKMNCSEGYANCFFASSPGLPWQHGRRQLGWYIRATLRKQFPNLTEQFILSHGIIGKMNRTKSRVFEEERISKRKGSFLKCECR